MIFSHDIARYYAISTGPRWRRILECYRSPGLHAIAEFRFGHWLLAQALPIKMILQPFYLLMHHRIRSKWGIEIQREAAINRGLYVGHWGGIFVAGGVVAGQDFTISQDVTLGISGEGPHRGVPKFGNNVHIAAGAKVVGKVYVGNNVRIGPNAVVMKDIPDNSVVHAPPSRIVLFPSPTSHPDPQGHD
jgi:serine O-acetyltransferase